MNAKKLLVPITVIILGVATFVLYSGGQSLPRGEAVETSVVDLNNGDTYDLVAAYVTKHVGGGKQKMLAYNGSIPGPTIRVGQGAEVTINFKNETDLPTLLHSHGVRMENAFDGSQLQQGEIKPGQSFTYKLKFPDAGVYWYHPHVKEPYAQALGLYGAFVVVPSDPEYFPPVNRELVVFLSDISLGDGKIAIDKDVSTHSLMGHYGNVMLVNGEENLKLKVNQGEVTRLYLVNSANARPFNFGIKGLNLKLVGGDNGAYEKESFVDSVLLGPSERAIVDVFVPGAGVYEMQNRTGNKIYKIGYVDSVAGSVGVSYENEFNKLRENGAAKESIAPFRKYFNGGPDKNITLTLDMGGGMMDMPGMGHEAHIMPGGSMMRGSVVSANSGGIEWEDTNTMMNSMSTPDSIKWKIVDRDSGLDNMNIGWSLENGKPVKVRIFNDPNSMHPMQHPIHFHGQRFLVVSRDDVRETNLVWKDTVLVKSGETVDIVLDPSNPGTWMAHCHISEHLEAGMMFAFKVE